MKLINHHLQPITLDGGTILAAAGTDGSQKEVAEITDRDRRRHVDTGRIAIVEESDNRPQITRSTKEEMK